LHPTIDPLTLLVGARCPNAKNLALSDRFGAADRWLFQPLAVSIRMATHGETATILGTTYLY
jgi:hypothetical protein